jgi:isopentenyldiphosphate isomerase
MTVQWIEEASYYRYQFLKMVLWRMKYVHPYLIYHDTPVINPDEVEAIEWIDWSDFLAIKNNTDSILHGVSKAMILKVGNTQEKSFKS